LKITIFGRELYTPRLIRGKTWQETPNAIVKASHLIRSLEEWAIKYEEREKVQLENGQIVPKAQVTGIKMSRAAGGASSNCNIYFEVRLPPGTDPKLIHKELSALTRSLDVKCDVSLYQWSRGYIAQNVEPLIDALQKAHKYVLRTELPNPPSPEVSMWRDLNAYNEVNIPSVCYGPPRQKEQYSDTQDRAMKISDLVAATKIYAITIMQICAISS
jgi:acetylornithine deacetylase/succinyl-diaminopimelate desuccinylase-like protein